MLNNAIAETLYFACLLIILISDDGGTHIYHAVVNISHYPRNRLILTRTQRINPGNLNQEQARLQ